MRTKGAKDLKPRTRRKTGRKTPVKQIKKVTTPKIKFTANKQRVIDVLGNVANNMTRRLEHNKGVSFPNTKDKDRLEIKKIMKESIMEKNSIPLENINRRLIEMLTTDQKVAYKIRQKDMAVWEDWWETGIHTSGTGFSVYNGDISNKQTILQALINKGYDVYDPRVLKDTLKGLTYNEIYYVYKAMNNGDLSEFYEDFYMYLEDTIDDVLEEIRQPGFNLDDYMDEHDIIMGRKY